MRHPPAVAARHAAASVTTLTLLTALALGCGSTRPAGPPVSSPQFGEDAQGIVHFWDRADLSHYGERLVKQFNATHDDVTVKLTPILDKQFVTKLATAIRSDSAPDLVGIDDINSQLFIQNDAFMDLTPAVNRLPFKEHLSPGHLRLTTRDGRYYGVPYVADLSMLWYNKELFRRAGLDPNNPPDTYREILTAAREISQLGPNTWGFAFPGNCQGCLGFQILPSIWATGTRLIKGEVGQQKANIAGNKALKRTLQLYHKLWSRGWATPASRTEDGTTRGQDFLAGKVGILPAGYGGVMQNITPGMRGKVGAAPLPGPDGGYSTFVGGANFGIPKGADNPSGAWKFVKFVLQKQQQAQAPKAGIGLTPIRTDVLTTKYKSKYPLNAVVLRALPKGYAPKTLAYNITFNQPGGPWLTMFNTAVFQGKIDKALKIGQEGFSNALVQAGSS